MAYIVGARIDLLLLVSTHSRECDESSPEYGARPYLAIVPLMKSDRKCFTTSISLLLQDCSCMHHS